MLFEPDLITTGEAMYVSEHCNYFRLTYNRKGLPLKIETSANISKIKQ